MSINKQDCYWFVIRCLSYNYAVDPRTKDIGRMKQFFADLHHLVPSLRYTLDKGPITEKTCCQACLQRWCGDYLSNNYGPSYDGVHIDVVYKNPKYWGKYFWLVMEDVASLYPNDPTSTDIMHAQSFYNILKYLLPCKICIEHYRKLLKKYPVDEKTCCHNCLVAWVKLVKDLTYNKSSKANDKNFKNIHKDKNIHKSKKNHKSKKTNKNKSGHKQKHKRQSKKTKFIKEMQRHEKTIKEKEEHNKNNSNNYKYIIFTNK